MKLLQLELYWQILLALILAVICGLLTDIDTTILNINIYNIYSFLGKLFLNALQLASIPLIIASIISGVANIGNNGNIKSLGIKTIGYYLLTSFLAIIVGLFFVNIIKPGISTISIADINLLQGHDSLAKDYASAADNYNFFNLFLKFVPKNIFAAAVNGQLLGLVFCSVIFGLFMTRIASELNNILHKLWTAIFETMMLITIWIMRFAPIGVFGLVAKVMTSVGISAFVPVMKFFIAVIISLSIHMFIILPLLLYFLGRINPIGHFKAMLAAILTAFSTASSLAALPVSMECVEKNSGASNKITSFVLPLGATVNMDGTALYECIAVLFIAQIYGVELNFATQMYIVFLALFTSIGVASIPSASLVAIALILGALGLPLEGMGILMVTDRILDMCRTAVNIFSDSCGAVIIARSEGEVTRVALSANAS